MISRAFSTLSTKMININRVYNTCSARFLSITYSGGQATEGQGGYYGSGGARVISQEGVVGREQILAMAHDLQKIQAVMKEYQTLESLARSEHESTETPVTAKMIEIKASIKRLMTAPEVIEALNNLEVNGEPTWGLSCDERALITLAREKVSEC